MNNEKLRCFGKPKRLYKCPVIQDTLIIHYSSFIINYFLVMIMLDIIKAIFFGIVEGITEWLPISSTGHLILLKKWFPMNIQDEVWDLFLVVVQLGAIFASVILFWQKIWPFQKYDSSKGQTIFKKESWELWFKVAIASIPGVVFKLLKLDEVCDKYFYNPIGIAIALIVFGILFIVIECFYNKANPKYCNTTDISYGLAVCIGLFQIVAAAFPGTSRSGVTILGAADPKHGASTRV